MKYYVYFLRCEDDSIYIGISKNVEKRFQEHLEKRGAKYTKSHPVSKILFSMTCESKSEALKLEYFFKTWSKKQKEEFLQKASEEWGRFLYQRKKWEEKKGKKKI
ncbi:GIY-YIG nuclease family protein [Fusobacterium necrophorum]|uniref:GIY-YIG nuclease family protein n=1 Tax=Fusobacterium necrophorum TaxID=859 RepID=UPI0021C321FC|nr:GIY-YIG nuclease family protein [Fusobacterium necrophorum]